MRKFLLLSVIFISTMVFSQVGINTKNPRATLDVKAKTDGAKTPEGILVPSLTEKQIEAMPVTAENNGMFIYNTTQNCMQVYTNNKWECVNTQVAKENFLVAEYQGTNGTWVQNVSAEGNTITFKVTNHADANFAGLNFKNALTLNGASQGLSYEAAGDYTNIALSGGQSKVLVYNIKGTPLSYGTLTANFSAMGGAVKAYGTVQVQEQSAVKALKVVFKGKYIANKRLTAENKVSLTVHNFSTQAVNNTDLSSAIIVNGIEGVSVQPNQNTSVSIPVGGEVTLNYILQGVPAKSGNLVATFNPNEVVSGNASATQQIVLFSNVSVSNMQIMGDYVVQQAMNSKNKVQVTLTNNNAYALEHLNAKDALSLSGNYQNINIVENQNTDFSIPAKGSKVISYTLAGEPQNGGDMKATWQQTPFGSTSAKKTIAQFNVSPTTFYFGANDNGTGTITVRSSEAWRYEVLDAQSWVKVNNVTGQSGNGTISFTTKPHTSAQPEIGFIRIYRNDGNGIKVTLRQPPTDDLTTNIPPVNKSNRGGLSDEKFSINGVPKDYTVTYNGNWGVQSYPDWVESAIKINNNTVRVTPKTRQDPGEYRFGNIVFSYGAGYLKAFEIAQKQRAEICPPALPAGIRADKGYLVWHYKDIPTFDELSTLYEERSGNNDFEDVQLYSPYNAPHIYIRKKVVKTTTKSRLFLGPVDEKLEYFSAGTGDYSSYYYRTYWSAFVNKQGKIDSAYGSPIELYKYKRDDEQKRSRVTQVICVDGRDENTPSKP